MFNAKYLVSIFILETNRPEKDFVKIYLKFLFHLYLFNILILQRICESLLYFIWKRVSAFLIAFSIGKIGLLIFIGNIYARIIPELVKYCKNHILSSKNVQAQVALLSRFRWSLQWKRSVRHLDWLETSLVLAKISCLACI